MKQTIAYIKNLQYQERHRALLIYAIVIVCVVVGAFVLRDWIEGIAVLLIVVVTTVFAIRAKDRIFTLGNRRMDSIPKVAHMRLDRGIIDKPVGVVNIGEIIVVRSDERSPLDGVIVNGSAIVNERYLTGSKLELEKKVGDSLYAGSLVTKGTVEVEVISSYQDSVLTEVTNRFTEACATDFSFENRFENFVKGSMLILMLIAFLLATILPAMSATGVLQVGSFSQWVHQALCLLVLASPCALFLVNRTAVPCAAIDISMCGGVIASAHTIELAACSKTCYFECSDVLLAKEMRVEDVIVFASDINIRELVIYAASLETSSQSSVGRAIINAAYESGFVTYPQREGYMLYTVPDARETLNAGIQGTIGGRRYATGSLQYMQDLCRIDDEVVRAVAEVTARACRPVLVCDEYHMLGLIVVAQDLRPGAQNMVSRLKKNDPEIAILSDDQNETVQAVSNATGIAKAISCRTDERKIMHLQKGQGAKNTISYVCRPDVAMPIRCAVDLIMGIDGLHDSEVRNNSDIILMGQDPMSAVSSLRMARRSILFMRMKLALLVVFKAVTLLLCLANVLNSLWLVAAVEAFLTLGIVALSIRSLR